MFSTSAACPYKRASGSKYRKVEYNDGEVVRIQETRRRQPSKEPVPNLNSDSQTRHIENAQHPDAKVPALLKGQGDCYSSKRTPAQSNENRHVTAKSNAKPVLVQANTTKVRNSRTKANPVLATPMLPTPPPTPRMGRLETPELTDLEDSPFCDCCEDLKQVKYCASCGVKLDRY